MIYKWTTLKPVIGKFLRDTRTADGSYFDDLTDWVAEAIALMKTRFQLELKQTTVRIDFHHAALPCSLESLACVTYQGQRLLESGSLKPLNHAGYRSGPVFQTVVSRKELDEVDTPGGTVSLQALQALPASGELFYKLNYNKIETNISDGELELFYWAVPTDEDGFPMIPDNQLYKEAIYFYCRMKMIGTGYPDPVFKYGDCESRWTDYAGKAIAEITYPTPDALQRNIQTNIRLIPTDYHWENFGQGPSAEQSYYN